MNILLCSSTRPEMGSLYPPETDLPEGQIFPLLQDKEVRLWGFITGVGMTATAYHLGRVLALNSFDLAINIGLAGALHPDLHPGDVVEVISEEWADTGAEDHDDFLNLDQLGLWPSHRSPFENGVIRASRDERWASGLRQVSGATVNTVHGNARSIASFRQRCTAEVESMEGAAFFFACRMASVPCMQIRALSNRVEPRNRDSWMIQEALMALDRVMLEWWKKRIVNNRVE